MLDEPEGVEEFLEDIVVRDLWMRRGLLWELWWLQENGLVALIRKGISYGRAASFMCRVALRSVTWCVFTSLLRDSNKPSAQ